jgi:hypothetical protein
MERGHARILDDQSRLEYYFGNDAENWLNRTFAITPKKGTPIPIHSKKVMNKEGGGGLPRMLEVFWGRVLGCLQIINQSRDKMLI